MDVATAAVGAEEGLVAFLILSSAAASPATAQDGRCEEREYSILLMMSELSTVRCDRALGLWLQVHGRQVSTESCRGGAVADGPCGGRR